VNSIEKLIAKALPYLKGQAAQLRAHGFTGSKVHSEIEEIIRELEQTLARESAAPEPHLATRVLNGMEVETGEPMSAASAAPAYWTKERLRSELSDILVFGKSDAQIIAELELLIERRDREVARSSERDAPAVKRPELRHPPVAINCRCDGNKVCALIGSNLQEGVSGFGDNLPDALRDLADELEREVGEHPVITISRDAVRREALEEAAQHRPVIFSTDSEGIITWCCTEDHWRGRDWDSHIRVLAASPAGRASEHLTPAVERELERQRKKLERQP